MTTYHPPVDPANPVFEPGLSKEEFVHNFPNLLEIRPNLMPDHYFCLVCEKAIDAKSGSQIRRHLTGRYHILKYKSKELGITENHIRKLNYVSFVEKYPNVFKIVDNKLFCKICRMEFINIANSRVQEHLASSTHVKCEKVFNEHKDRMENMSKDEFSTFLSASFAAAKVPLDRINHPAMKNFIETISGVAVCSSQTLRQLQESLAKTEEGTEENEINPIQDHENYPKPSLKTIQLEKRLQVKKRVMETVNSQPKKAPQKKRKRDIDRQLKREELANIKNEDEMSASSLSDTLENTWESLYSD